MIIPKEARLTPEQEQELRDVTGEFGITLQTIAGDHRTVFAMHGDERHELLIARLEGLEYIERVDTIQQPYKLMTKENDLASHKIRFNGKVIAGVIGSSPSTSSGSWKGGEGEGGSDDTRDPLDRRRFWA